MNAKLKLWLVAASVSLLAACGGGDDEPITTEQPPTGTNTSIVGVSEAGTLNFNVYTIENDQFIVGPASATVERSGLSGTATYGTDFASTEDDWENITWSTGVGGKLEADGNVVLICSGVDGAAIGISDNMTAVTDNTSLYTASFQTFNCNGTSVANGSVITFNNDGTATDSEQLEPIPANVVSSAFAGTADIKLIPFVSVTGKRYIVEQASDGAKMLTLWVESVQ